MRREMDDSMSERCGIGAQVAILVGYSLAPLEITHGVSVSAFSKTKRRA